ncbi:SPAPB24D3.06c [Cucurbita argyrosperma subsp. argyrosperma]|nr:SPAPB24D3.06c [Cucurbita argyrosperma subsp. argyrosperma]
MNLSLSSSSSSSLPSASASSSSSSPSSSSTTSWFSGIVRGRPDRSSSVKMSGSSASGFAAGDPPGPVVRKNHFRGLLFKYGPKPIQQVIFIGGLTDGFMATEYLEPLAIALDKEKWSLVQILLSSSYSGYGTSSLQQDAKELDQLVSYLINKEDSEGVVLLGHSTGCQDIVYYMRTNAACSRAVRGAILQAPVSDREYRATLPETAAMIDLASTMINEGRGLDLMPREADPSPITATRLCKAMGGAEKVEIQHGNHSLSNRVNEAVDAIIDFVKREGPKGWDDPWH